MPNTEKTVATPRVEHENMQLAWKKIRAAVAGEDAVKAYDAIVSPGNNLLVPFSTVMVQDQYNFFRSEARFLGFSSDFVRTSVGAMLRKEPEITIPNDDNDEVVDWIRNRFTGNDESLISFLDKAIPDQMQTGNTWVGVDYDGDSDKPVPMLFTGETVINWEIGDHPVAGKGVLLMLAVKTAESVAGDNEFHPDEKDVVRVHSLNEKGEYTIRRFEQDEKGVWDVVSTRIPTKHKNSEKGGFPLDFIPIWSLSGCVGISQPYVQNFVNAEIGHYNANSRRNHLLYGSSSYTPVIIGNLEEGDADKITESGVGTYLFLPEGAKAEILSTPTDALKDLEAAISTEKDNMAKLGARALSPEASSRESGVSLDIRNSTSSASLSAFSRRMASTLRKVVTLMVNWRNGTDIDESDVVFTLSTNFTRPSAGEAAVLFAFELWKAKLITKEYLLRVAKDNDFLPADLVEDGLDKKVVKEFNARNKAGLNPTEPVQTELNIPES